MSVTTRQLNLLTGIGAISAFGAHLITDVIEWAIGSYSAPQLWLNYAAFVCVPFVMVGLFAAQRNCIGFLGFWGALLYGASFVYFSHSTLYALVEQIPDYESLWKKLGNVYTLHGVSMILGGALFGISTFRARYFPRWLSVLFLAGILTNLALGLSAAPEVFQIFGSALRNAGLMGMGVYLVRRPDKV